MPYLLPLGDIPATLIPAVLALPGVFGIITLRRVLDGGVIVRRVGRSWPREAAFALVGIPLGVLGRAIGLSTDPHLLPTTVVATFGLFTVAMVEELAVRGYLQSALGPILGVVPAMGVVAIVGAAPAVADPAAFLLAVVAGIAFGWWISRGNGVLGAGLAHGVALVLISLWPAIAR